MCLFDLFFKKKNINKNVSIVKKVEPVSTHHDYIYVKTTKKDEDLLNEFIEENKIQQDSWHYRKGAAFTAKFGIEDGWGPNMEPGFVRIHPGVDRARGGSVVHMGVEIKDVVICPFNFEKTDFIDYKGQSYGSLVCLISEKYQFEFRIAHMHPNKDILPWALQQFKLKAPYKQNWIIGKAGTYGYSTAPHTHTEIVSTDESTEIFEIILYKKYGDSLYKEYSNEYIVSEYKKREKFKKATEGQILENWFSQKAAKNIIFINDFKLCFIWNNKVYTKYATNMLFNGL